MTADAAAGQPGQPAVAAAAVVHLVHSNAVAAGAAVVEQLVLPIGFVVAGVLLLCS